MATLPNPNPIPNIGVLEYSYSVNPTLPDIVKSILSNTVYSQVNVADLNITKVGNPSYAKMGDNVTYTFVVTNTGNVSANNILFKDTVPNGFNYIAGSLKINSVVTVGDPNVGVVVPTIPANGVTTIEFNVLVNTIPSVNPILNDGSIDYSYVYDPSTPKSMTSAKLSNIVPVTILQAVINNSSGIIKSVDKAYATKGETVTYIITVKNTGNTVANNVVIKDTIPNVTTLVPSSIKVNGTNMPSADLSVGVNVGTVNSGEVKSIEFKVIVNTVPNPNLFQNNAIANYTFTTFPTLPDGQIGGAISNLVDTRVNYADISEANDGLTKSVDKTEATLNEQITYTIVLKNKGNTDANNVIIKDTIPSNTTFVSGSVFVNGINRPADNVQNGVNIGTIIPNGVVTLTFKVTVVSVPNPNPIKNQGKVDYAYTVDPSIPNGNTQTNLTTIVNTVVNYAEISTISGGLIKSVDKGYAKLSDNVVYTIVLKNTGNVNANNVVLFDTIPQETTLVSGSVKVNGSSAVGTPSTGITVGTIAPNATATVEFTVLVITTPNSNKITNNADVAYNFLVLGANRDYRNTSNSVVTTIVNASTSVTKVVDKNFADVNDTVTYTLVVKNTGNINLSNAIVKDTIPTGTSFITGSVTINGVASPSGNVVTGINVGTLLVGEAKTITFKVNVDTIPSINPVVNLAAVDYTYKVNPTDPDSTGHGEGSSGGTKINNANFNQNNGGFTKSADLAYAKIGDNILYTLVLKNLGNVDANNVIVIDTVPGNTTYVSNTVLVNGVANSGNPNTGINVGTVNPAQVVTITFKVLVVSTLPNDTTPNTASLSFNYSVDPSLPNKNGGSNSNTVTTKVNTAIIDGSTGGIVKSADKVYVTKGEIVTYTITMKNTGNVVATNVIVKDTIPQETSFVANSFKLNGAIQSGVDITNPLGNNIGNINPSEVKIVEFKVIVNTVPNPNVLINDARASYLYTKNPSNPNGESGEGISNEVKVFVNYASFKEGEGGNSKTVDKKEATIGDVVTYTIVLKNVGNVPTNNTVFKDTIPTGTTFVPSSVVLNGVVLSTANPETGISLGTVQPLAVNTIVFKVTVNSIPIPLSTTNQGRVEYDFTVNPANPNGNKGVDLTTIVKTDLKYASIDKNTGGFSKVSDYQNVALGGNLRYTITIKNTGNIDANNVIVKDSLPKEVSYVAGSLTVNGVANAGDIQTGVNVGTVVPNGTVDVAFTVVVNTLPTNGKIENTGTVDYKFVVDGIDKNVTTTTNALTNSVVNGKLSVLKVSDKNYADVGDEILYSIIIKNEGNIDINTVTIKDTIPDGTTFVKDSLQVNNVAVPGADPGLGFSIGKISVNEVKTVSFKVKVTSIPVNNPIKNTVDVDYSYLVDPSLPAKNMKETAESNTTKINNANFNKGNLGFVKGVSKAYVTIGDEIEYTLTVTNLGNVDANNVIVKDTLPSNLQFVANSVKVNGVASSLSIESGVNIGTVIPGASSVVAFKAKVLSVMPSSIINNVASVNYSYIVDPNKPAVNKEEGSTNGISNIRVADLKITKVSNTNVAYVDNMIEYTIKVENKGNVDALNVFLIDTLSSGATFVENSLSINGTIIQGLNIVNGITIDKVAPNEVKVVKFKVKFTDVPRGSIFKNTAKGNYEFIVNPNEAPVKNTTNSNTNTVVVSIYVDPNKEVPIGNCPVTLANRINPQTLGNGSGNCGKIKYTVDGICSTTEKACVGEQIRNFKMWKQKTISTNSDLGLTDIEEIESIKGEVLFIRNERVKTPDTGNTTNAEGEKLTGEKEIVESIVRFTLRIITGDGDIIKKEFIQIFSSFIVIEREYLGMNLIPKSCVEDIEIVSLCNGKIELTSTVLIYLSTGSNSGCGISCEEEVETNYISISNLCPNISEFLESGQTLWKEFDVYSNLIDESSNIGEILSVNGAIDILNYKVIKTPLAMNTSNEGLELRGNKLLINMLLTIKLNYMEGLGKGIVKRKNIKVPVGTYIIVGEDINACELNSFNIKTCIEDIFVYNSETSGVFSNTTIIVKATPCAKKPLC
ncbi:MAG: beta strand repeat-containing protein [Clostridium sp.]